MHKRLNYFLEGKMSNDNKYKKYLSMNKSELAPTALNLDMLVEKQALTDSRQARKALQLQLDERDRVLDRYEKHWVTRLLRWWMKLRGYGGQWPYWPLSR